MIFWKIAYELLRLRLWERIPTLPRGMLSARYDSISTDERRVLARLGARDPRGINLALKRAGAADVDELVSGLEHFAPRRHVIRRINLMIDRVTMGSRRHPHGRELTEDRRAERRAADIDTECRLRATIAMLKEPQ